MEIKVIMKTTTFNVVIGSEIFADDIFGQRVIYLCCYQNWKYFLMKGRQCGSKSESAGTEAAAAVGNNNVSNKAVG